VISIGVTIAIYLMFEKFFMVPLPKGPLEELLYL
jgi:putative tricarboxylic transport membrane protein